MMGQMKPFSIGNVRIDPPLALAPMAEVTDTYYRSLIKELGGAGLVVSEFISAEGLTRTDLASGSGVICFAIVLDSTPWSGQGRRVGYLPS